jgi:hypothetical protein
MGLLVRVSRPREKGKRTVKDRNLTTNNGRKSPGKRDKRELLRELHEEVTERLARWLRRQGPNWLTLTALAVGIAPEDARRRVKLEPSSQGGKRLGGRAKVYRGFELLLPEVVDKLQRDGVCEVRTCDGVELVRLIESPAAGSQPHPAVGPGSRYDWLGTEHKQVTVAWGGRRAEVDEELAPLILALWKADIDTWNSCQENRPGIVWIQFPTTDDARRFLNRVAEYPPDSDRDRANDRPGEGDGPFPEALYDRVVGCGSDEDWEYDTLLDNEAVEVEVVDDERIERRTGPADFYFSVSVRFPRTDLPVVLRRVEDAVRPE